MFSWQISVVVNIIKVFVNRLREVDNQQLVSRVDWLDALCVEYLWSPESPADDHQYGLIMADPGTRTLITMKCHCRDIHPVGNSCRGFFDRLTEDFYQQWQDSKLRSLGRTNNHQEWGQKQGREPENV